jgi:hypothetical protein
MQYTTLALCVASILIPTTLAGDILKTNGFTNCNDGDSTIQVKNVDISFDKSNNEVTFDVAGSSATEQEVTAELIVTAYGIQVYTKSFDPCDSETKVDQLCPGKCYIAWSFVL